MGPGGVNFGQQGSDDVSLTLLNRARNKKSITLNSRIRRGGRCSPGCCAKAMSSSRT
ncbi:CAIB/BAIF family protein [Bordetella pertussis]|nr:CAIB/BAIF family protein [Bordetella pertussis]